MNWFYIKISFSLKYKMMNWFYIKISFNLKYKMMNWFYIKISFSLKYKMMNWFYINIFYNSNCTYDSYVKDILQHMKDLSSTLGQEPLIQW